MSFLADLLLPLPMQREKKEKEKKKKRMDIHWRPFRTLQ
jgi:hypothetical protein